MGFTFGRSEEIGRVEKKENKQATDVVMLNYSLIQKEHASIHKAGCRDIKKDANKHGAHFGGRFVDTKSALESFIDEEACRLGFDEDYWWKDVVRVFPCAEDESYKANENEQPTYLTKYEGAF